MSDLYVTVAERVCRRCGCTDDAACLVDLKTGDVLIRLNADQQIDFNAGGDADVDLCYWVEPDLCSACMESPPPPLLYGADGRPLRGAP